MALDLVTGYQGKNHVTAEQWADFNRGVYGDAAILPIGNRMQVEIQTANQITVKDGTGVFDGRQVYIGYGEPENIAIESGTQEMLRNDIVVIEYTKDESTGVESAAFKVIAGTPAASDPADPSYQDMDIRTGVFVSQKPFCRVRLNGVAIEGVDMLVEVKEFAAHAFQPPAANLTTTKPGQALDATMGKELKEGFDQLNSSSIVFRNGLSNVETIEPLASGFFATARKIGAEISMSIHVTLNSGAMHAPDRQINAPDAQNNYCTDIFRISGNPMGVSGNNWSRLNGIYIPESGEVSGDTGIVVGYVPESDYTVIGYLSGTSSPISVPSDRVIFAVSA